MTLSPRAMEALSLTPDKSGGYTGTCAVCRGDLCVVPAHHKPYRLHCRGDRCAASAILHAAGLGSDDLLSRRPTPGRKAVLTLMADVEPRSVDWLWPGRIAKGRISLIVGMPGCGKSFLTCDMAARVSTGTPWPDGSPSERGNVLLVNYEDDPGDTIRPRLDALHADVGRITVISGVEADGKPGMFTLGDLDALEDALQRTHAKLLVVDPIGSALGGKVDAHRDNEVRSVLAPLAKLAEECGVAVVLVAHRRKAAATAADDLALGSRAFTGIARAVWHLSADPAKKGRRLFLPGKCNLAAQQSGLAFAIAGEPAAIRWERDPVELTADEALAAENAAGNTKGESLRVAVDFLRVELAEGRRPQAEIVEAAEAAGIRKRTLERAKAELGVVPTKTGFSGAWHWELPAHEDCQAVWQPSQKTNVSAEGCQIMGTGNLRENPPADDDPEAEREDWESMSRMEEYTL